MKRTLYVETNFIIGVAKGQDADAADLLESSATDIHLVIPGICFMEALSVWEYERKLGNKFNETLSSRMREVGRDTTSPRAKALARLLDESMIESKHLVAHVRARLEETIDRLSIDAEILEINRDILFDSLTTDYINDSNDNLIFCSILWHARRNPVDHKALLSTNHNDFGQPDVEKVLLDTGVKYFRGTMAAINWLRSRPEP